MNEFSYNKIQSGFLPKTRYIKPVKPISNDNIMTSNHKPICNLKLQKTKIKLANKDMFFIYLFLFIILDY